MSMICFVWSKACDVINCSACRPHSVSTPMLSTSVYFPKSTLGESPSLLSTSNRPSGDRLVSRPKRKKVDSYHEEVEEVAPLTPPQAASPGRPHITQPAHPPSKVWLAYRHIGLRVNVTFAAHFNREKGLSFVTEYSTLSRGRKFVK